MIAWESNSAGRNGESSIISSDYALVEAPAKCGFMNVGQASRLWKTFAWAQKVASFAGRMPALPYFAGASRLSLCTSPLGCTPGRHAARVDYQGHDSV